MLTVSAFRFDYTWAAFILTSTFPFSCYSRLDLEVLKRDRQSGTFSVLWSQKSSNQPHEPWCLCGYCFWKHFIWADVHVNDHFLLLLRTQTLYWREVVASLKEPKKKKKNESKRNAPSKKEKKTPGLWVKLKLIFTLVLFNSSACQFWLSYWMTFNGTEN